MKKTILLVEDDQWIGECYQTWLHGFGYKTVWVRDAQSALDVFDETKVDAVLLDIMLPFANGIHFLNVVASHADLMHIPVVVCSSLPPQESLKPYGVQIVLDKTTLTPKQLQTAIHGVFAHAAVSH